MFDACSQWDEAKSSVYSIEKTSVYVSSSEMCAGAAKPILLAHIASFKKTMGLENGGQTQS